VPVVGENLKEAVRSYEEIHIENVLRRTGYDKRKAAELLGVGLSSLYLESASSRRVTLPGPLCLPLENGDRQDRLPLTWNERRVVALPYARNPALSGDVCAQANKRGGQYKAVSEDSLRLKSTQQSSSENHWNASLSKSSHFPGPIRRGLLKRQNPRGPHSARAGAERLPVPHGGENPKTIGISPRTGTGWKSLSNACQTTKPHTAARPAEFKMFAHRWRVLDEASGITNARSAAVVHRAEIESTIARASTTTGRVLRVWLRRSAALV
jgi:hypothetical protein